MTKPKVPQFEAKSKVRPKVTYHGPARLGDDLVVQCAVLEDGRRGYVQRSLREAVGLKRNLPLPAFAGFLSEIAPNALKYIGKTSSPVQVRMPNGATGVWVEAGILTEIANGVIGAALDGNLGSGRQHMIAPCRAILRALGKTGEIALIDEATGHQYHREPDALQDIITQLIREEAKDWDLRFPPHFYRSLCRLWGFSYGNKHAPLPWVIGQVTRRWVYDVVFPPEIMAEIKARRRSEKMHQWLKDGGIKLLEKQRDAVAIIAQSAVDPKDFEARCSAVFNRPGTQVSMAFPQEAA